MNKFLITSIWNEFAEYYFYRTVKISLLLKKTLSFRCWCFMWQHINVLTHIHPHNFGARTLNPLCLCGCNNPKWTSHQPKLLPNSPIQTVQTIQQVQPIQPHTVRPPTLNHVHPQIYAFRCTCVHGYVCACICSALSIQFNFLQFQCDTFFMSHCFYCASTVSFFHQVSKCHFLFHIDGIYIIFSLILSHWQHNMYISARGAQTYTVMYVHVSVCKRRQQRPSPSEQPMRSAGTVTAGGAPLLGSRVEASICILLYTYTHKYLHMFMHMFVCVYVRVTLR